MNKTIDAALAGIIDQWYHSVSEYYITKEKKEQDAGITEEEELKRFHDEKGHRIKFAKGELDFTYGLRLRNQQDTYQIEVSVNNKVADFNYDKLVSKLDEYYTKNRHVKVTGGKALKGVFYTAIFAMDENFQRSIVVEKREGKADIIRLAFQIHESYVKDLTSDHRAVMNIIQDYCVSPLRKVYAEVYRQR
ncbi:MAG: hypothetical protein HYR55_04360 [Acidobacteria bacterium]|nr:hypothetical protein [Acidobacteriota bacterium]MBI3656323.1 hypothetical protein [Acidobacteriota bacterium]